MLQSISSSGAPAGGVGGPSAASLQAQLQRFQQQLSDCVNCASAKTPQGKAAIQALSAKVSLVEQKIGAQQNTGPGGPAAGVAASGMASPAQAAVSDPGAIGGTINVYA